MPILVAPFDESQEWRVREIVKEEIAAWYGSAIPGSKDRDGKPFSRSQADFRGVYAYDATEGGVLEKRSDALEAQAQSEAAEQDSVQEALSKPILP